MGGRRLLRLHPPAHGRPRVPPARHPRQQARPGAGREPRGWPPDVRRHSRDRDHALCWWRALPGDSSHRALARGRTGGRVRPGHGGHRGDHHQRLPPRGGADRALGDGRPGRPGGCSASRSSAATAPASGSTPPPRCSGPVAASTTSPGWTSPTRRRSARRGRCCRSRRGGSRSGCRAYRPTCNAQCSGPSSRSAQRPSNALARRAGLWIANCAPDWRAPGSACGCGGCAATAGRRGVRIRDRPTVVSPQAAHRPGQRGDRAGRASAIRACRCASASSNCSSPRRCGFPPERGAALGMGGEVAAR